METEESKTDEVKAQIEATMRDLRAISEKHSPGLERLRGQLAAAELRWSTEVDEACEKLCAAIWGDPSATFEDLLVASTGSARSATQYHKRLNDGWFIVHWLGEWSLVHACHGNRKLRPAVRGRFQCRSCKARADEASVMLLKLKASGLGRRGS